MNETPLDFTDYQKEYGQGENGVRPITPGIPHQVNGPLEKNLRPG